MELAYETFNAAKELSDINLAIADGRSTLSAITDDTEIYLKAREADAHKRVDKVLTESRDALQEINKNYEELKAYGNELRAYALTLTGFHDNLIALGKDFRERVELADLELTVKGTQVQDVFQQARIERAQVTEDRKQLGRERAQISEAWKEVSDRREAFERAWEELKAKQNNQ